MVLIGVFAFGWALNAMSSVRYTLETSARALQMKNSLRQAEI
ncbi:hypothetical protein NKJ72_20740 [Mesorhizobium sp. M0045]